MAQITVDVPQKRLEVIGKNHVSIDFLIDFAVDNSDKGFLFSELTEDQLSESAKTMFNKSLNLENQDFKSIAHR